MPKIIIDQEGCIRCGKCSALCPKVFEMNAQGKSQLKVDYQENGPADGSVPNEISCVKDAEENCPVDVITVKK